MHIYIYIYIHTQTTVGRSGGHQRVYDSTALTESEICEESQQPSCNHNRSTILCGQCESRVVSLKPTIHEATFVAGNTATLFFVHAAHEISHATFYKSLGNRWAVYSQATCRIQHAIFHAQHARTMLPCRRRQKLPRVWSALAVLQTTMVRTIRPNAQQKLKHMVAINVGVTGKGGAI